MAVTEGFEELPVQEKQAPKTNAGRPTEWDYPERIDASPEAIAEAVLSMPPKKRGAWRFKREAKGPA